jgi:hypothetical protein
MSLFKFQGNQSGFYMLIFIHHLKVQSEVILKLASLFDSYFNFLGLVVCSLKQFKVKYPLI